MAHLFFKKKTDLGQLDADLNIRGNATEQKNEVKLFVFQAKTKQLFWSLASLLKNYFRF